MLSQKTRGIRRVESLIDLYRLVYILCYCQYSINNLGIHVTTLVWGSWAVKKINYRDDLHITVRTVLWLRIGKGLGWLTDMAGSAAEDFIQIRFNFPPDSTFPFPGMAKSTLNPEKKVKENAFL